MSKKNAIPMPTSSGSVLPKLVGALVVAALLVIVVKHPSDAADWTKQLFGLAGDAVDGIVSFIRQIA